MRSQSKLMSMMAGLLITLCLSGIAQAKNAIYPAIAECEAQIQKQDGVGDHNKKLNQSLDFIWAQWMKEYPEWATYVGHPGQDGHWSDRSMATIQKRKQLPSCQEKLLAKINPKK